MMLAMLPEQFLNRMEKMLGKDYGLFLESYDQPKYQALRVNHLKDPGEEIRKRADFLGEEVPWAQGGYYYKEESHPGKHPFHEAGVYYIQEPSAMMPAELLDARPGERVLDLCAAPGGKSTQIAAGMKGRGILFCNEIHPARAKILSENIERMGICNACVTNETPERLAERFQGYFDRILIDAPCSGEGMFRKNDGACGEWSTDNIKLCAKRQDGILDCGAGMLRPGGRLVYSTCTFAPEENEGSIDRFLKRHPDFSLLPVEKDDLGLSGCDGRPDFLAETESGLEAAVRIWPHKVDGEGHFAAVLQKTGGLPGGGNRRGMREMPARNREKAPEELALFCKEQLRLPKQRVDGGADLFGGIGDAAGMGDAVEVLRFGENQYLVPGGLPELKGLKVLRPGLHLGELKRNRFEPAHALALALAPEYAAHVLNLEAGSPEAAAYLRGETFPAEGEKGWYLICADGFSMGWGKLAGGMMKNHYPIGLRRKGQEWRK